MIVADLGRAAAAGQHPGLRGAGRADPGPAVRGGVHAGTLSVFFTVSDAGLFVALVPGGRYVEGNSLIYRSRALSGSAGPSLGGLLVEALVRAVRAGSPTRSRSSARRSSSAGSARPSPLPTRTAGAAR